mmetsp:Transcript_63680/g.170626  ORF Transcript_63680/g.170626 Transcript_63680/m.170626 type:complete len:350 (+) Transcript_63680:1211-2260(+)
MLLPSFGATLGFRLGSGGRIASASSFRLRSSSCCCSSWYRFRRSSASRYRSPAACCWVRCGPLRPALFFDRPWPSGPFVARRFAYEVAPASLVVAASPRSSDSSIGCSARQNEAVPSSIDFWKLASPLSSDRQLPSSGGIGVKHSTVGSPRLWVEGCATKVLVPLPESKNDCGRWSSKLLGVRRDDVELRCEGPAAPISSRLRGLNNDPVDDGDVSKPFVRPSGTCTRERIEVCIARGGPRYCRGSIPRGDTRDDPFDSTRCSGRMGESDAARRLLDNANSGGTQTALIPELGGAALDISMPRYPRGLSGPTFAGLLGLGTSFEFTSPFLGPSSCINEAKAPLLPTGFE